MAATITPEVQDRIETERRECVSRLARQASHFETAPEVVTGGHVVRNPRIPGRVEVVNRAGECTCRRFAVRGRCKHAALVEEWHGPVGANRPRQ